MSTFDGHISEFPDIRSTASSASLPAPANPATFDFFRPQAGVQPPLACFLSHVHSDHLAGLESLRSPFVYCSPATREILLRLERYPCRINYAEGILEARQQTYKHLRNILKPLPLETPVILELQPGQHIQVTLLDANHCPGAVMFLVEGDGKAILYTGDIRSEPWHVNTLARSPNLIEYTNGIKTLDTVYLDTSFIDDFPFQTKAEGLTELLQKVAQYPQDTVFHFQAWTYGYEEVWVALSRFLKSPIHVDDYKMRIYNSLKIRASDDRFSADLHLTPDAPALVGYRCGNSPHPGCLTADPGVRLHSCEKGNMCATAQGPSVVQIQPIIAHLQGGTDLAEVGVGGGADDLERQAEMDILSADNFMAFLEMIASAKDVPEQTRADIGTLLASAAESGRNVTLDLDISSFGEELSTSLERALKSITNRSLGNTDPNAALHHSGDQLPRTIRFPYSRHSSYPELCHLVDLFKPKDVWPCTVEPKLWLKNSVSIRTLFGRYCSGHTFRHDFKMAAMAERRADLHGSQESQPAETQRSSHSAMGPISSPIEGPSSATPCQWPRRDAAGSSLTLPDWKRRLVSPLPETQANDSNDLVVEMDTDLAGPKLPAENGEVVAVSGQPQKRAYDDFADDPGEQGEPEDSQETERSFTSTLSMRHSLARREAYYQMLENANTGDWTSIGLLSTNDSHTVMDEEL